MSKWEFFTQICWFQQIWISASLSKKVPFWKKIPNSPKIWYFLSLLKFAESQQIGVKISHFEKKNPQFLAKKTKYSQDFCQCTRECCCKQYTGDSPEKMLRGMPVYYRCQNSFKTYIIGFWIGGNCYSRLPMPNNVYNEYQT